MREIRMSASKRTILWNSNRTGRPQTLKPKRLLIAPAAVVSSFSVSAHAACRHVKCSKELHDSDDRVTPVIIQYTADTNASDEANVIAHGGHFKAHLHGIHAAAAELTPSQLDALAADEKIAHVSVDH